MKIDNLRHIVAAFVLIWAVILLWSIWVALCSGVLMSTGDVEGGKELIKLSMFYWMDILFN